MISFDGVFVQETYSTFKLQTFDKIETFNKSVDGKIFQIDLDASSKFLTSPKKTQTNQKNQRFTNPRVEGSDYRLTVDGYSGNAGDTLR